MKQYLDLTREVISKGTYKKSAREGMPGTISLFGYQFRHDLSEGFPLLTTKKLSFKNIVVELLWFLRGDTNIKYLIDNGCNIWNEDAYNYYIKLCESELIESRYSYEEFINMIKGNAGIVRKLPRNYIPGDCGIQYGKLWRNLEYGIVGGASEYYPIYIDQFKDLIQGLKDNPYGRRHIISAWNPSTLDQMALNACHALVQFNCRALSYNERFRLYSSKKNGHVTREIVSDDRFEDAGIPKYKLDCQMYQRSADLFLGVPYNIASYALLTHIIAKICNMVPGDFIHSFGDVHIYENHVEQIREQIGREPKDLPKLLLKDEFHYMVDQDFDLDEMINSFEIDFFKIEGYDPHPAIKGKLSTGLR